jgi:hypothetical protein
MRLFSIGVKKEWRERYPGSANRVQRPEHAFLTTYPADCVQRRIMAEVRPRCQKDVSENSPFLDKEHNMYNGDMVKEAIRQRINGITVIKQNMIKF